MNIPEAKGYSIWLMFQKDDEILFQSIIDELCKEFNSPLFKPHLTLLAGIEEEEENLFNKFSKIVENLNSFYIKVVDVKYSIEFYKSFFLEIEKDKFLEDLFRKAINIFDLKINSSDFHPHISLLYSNESIEIKALLLERFAGLVDKKIFVNKISLVKTEGIPSNWEELINFQL